MKIEDGGGYISIDLSVAELEVLRRALGNVHFAPYSMASRFYSDMKSEIERFLPEGTLFSDEVWCQTADE